MIIVRTSSNNITDPWGLKVKRLNITDFCKVSEDSSNRPGLLEQWYDGDGRLFLRDAVAALFRQPATVDRNALYWQDIMSLRASDRPMVNGLPFLPREWNDGRILLRYLTRNVKSAILES